MFLDDVVRVGLPRLFATFQAESVGAYAIKVTRDAEIDMDDDLSKSLFEKMKKASRGGRRGIMCASSTTASMPEELLKFLIRKLGVVDEASIIPGGRYHNRKDLMDFPELGRPRARSPENAPAAAPAPAGTGQLFRGDCAAGHPASLSLPRFLPTDRTCCGRRPSIRRSPRSGSTSTGWPRTRTSPTPS